MAAMPKFAHVILQAGQSEAKCDFWCTLLNSHLVFAEGHSPSAPTTSTTASPWSESRPQRPRIAAAAA